MRRLAGGLPAVQNGQLVAGSSDEDAARATDKVDSQGGERARHVVGGRRVDERLGERVHRFGMPEGSGEDRVERFGLSCGASLSTVGLLTTALADERRDLLRMHYGELDGPVAIATYR